jgi:hypothetical protein
MVLRLQEKNMNEIVPFGKYRNQPIEVMLQDRSYVEWLCGQDWFRNKFVNIYNIAINDQEPTETPEHNKIQAMFLDDDFCKNFALIFCADVRLGEKFEINNKFEEDGIDVKFKFSCERFSQDKFDKTSDQLLKLYRIKELSEKCKTEDEFLEINELMRENSITNQYNVSYRIADLEENKGIIRHSVNCAIEIKPSLGDDYPSVLRQILRYKTNFNVSFVLLIDRYVGEGATIEQVRKIFEKSKIKILFVKDILDAK